MTSMPGLHDTYKKIEDLIAQKFWAEAHRACLEFLKLDPENMRVIRYKNKIEKEVHRLNKKALQEDLDNLKPLWEAEKYQDILDHLEKLHPYASAFPSLGHLIKKARVALQNQQKQQAEALFRQKSEAIGKLMSEQQFAQALQESEELRSLPLNHSRVQNFLRQMKDQYVNAMIASNQSLLQSPKYDDIIAFYQNLLRIHPLSKNLQKLLQGAQHQKRQNIIEEKRDFIYKGLDEIRILYQLKKYEKAFQAAQEILAIDPTNKVAKKWHNLAHQRLNKIAETRLIDHMKEQQKLLKEQFKQNRSQFINI